VLLKLSHFEGKSAGFCSNFYFCSVLRAHLNFPKLVKVFSASQEEDIDAFERLYLDESDQKCYGEVIRPNVDN